MSDRFVQLVARRDAQLRTLPTIASQNDIDNAIATLPTALPSKGYGTEHALDFVYNNILPALSPGQAGPRYFGFVTGGTLPVAREADFISTLYDQNVQVHLPDETISTVLESRTLDMLLDLLHLPRELFPGKTITTGATASNVLGLACGREHALRHAHGDPSYSVSEDGFGGATVRVFSDHPHASLSKAASIVGLGRSSVVNIGKTDRSGIDLAALENELQACPKGSLKGAIVALSFGEVNTGDFTNETAEVRKLCEKYNAWLHIDAAFGAFARIVPEIEHLARDLQLADSITADAHKWLNVPYDAGIFFCRSLEIQTAVFGPSPKSAPPAYLTPLEKSTPQLAPSIDVSAIPSPLNVGIENSRRFRALPIFSALIALGRDGYAELVKRNIAFARKLADWMTHGPGKEWYEVLNNREETGGSVPLNIVLFRAHGRVHPSLSYRFDAPTATGSASLVRAINTSRQLYVSPAKDAVRIAVSNWMTGLDNENSLDSEEDFTIVTSTLVQIMQADSESQESSSA